MKNLYLIGLFLISMTSSVLACDEEKAEPDCPEGSEHSWNPSYTTDKLNRFYSLEELISAEYEEGNYETATQYINEYLELADRYKSNWNFGNAIHDGYRYLGLISYKQGDIDQAAKYLVKAGESTGSPQLDSFGPELDLANLLLQEGRVEEVKTYLNGIKRFWDMDNGVVDSWLVKINNGGKPELSRYGDHRMTLTQKVINWLSLLWPVLISLIIYGIYRDTLSIFKFVPTSILLTYIATFASSFLSFFLLSPIMGITPKAFISPVIYIFTAIFSFVIPGLAAFCLSKVRYLHVQMS